MVDSRPSMDPQIELAPDFFEEHKSKFIFGLIAVILLFAIGSVIFFTRAARLNSEQEAFAAATTSEQLVAFIDSNPSDRLEGNARLLLAEKQLLAGDLHAVEETLIRFTAKHPTHPLLPAALLGLAKTQLQLDKPAEAEKNLQELNSKHAQSFAAPFGAISEAQLLAKKGEIAPARSILQEVITNNPQSPAAFLAENALRFIPAQKD